MTRSESERPSVLVVDDDVHIRSALEAVLAANGYQVYTAQNGAAAISTLEAIVYDVVLLDLGLPDIDGITVCHTVRKLTDAPILVLTVRDADQDKIAAFDNGADDYVTKPFSIGELLARMRALIRRAPQHAGSGVVRVGEIEVDVRRRLATRSGHLIDLTTTEADILSFMAQRAGSVVPYRAIMEHVWGPETEHDPNLLRVHVRNLRRKIEPNPAVPHLLLTETGIGYRLVQ